MIRAFPVGQVKEGRTCPTGMLAALLKRKEVFKLRLFQCVAAIVISVIMLTGCKKDATVAPVKVTHTSNMDGGTDNPPPPPPIKP